MGVKVDGFSVEEGQSPGQPLTLQGTTVTGKLQQLTRALHRTGAGPAPPEPVDALTPLGPDPRHR